MTRLVTAFAVMLALLAPAHAAGDIVTNSGGGLFLICLVILIISAARQNRTLKRRADYNRQIGQPDLAAPLPSEQYAAQRKGNRSVVTVLVIIAVLIVLFMFPWLLLVPLVIIGRL